MTLKRLARVFAEESGFPAGMAEEIMIRILTEARRPALLRRLQKKLELHSVYSKARIWAWVAPGNVPDPIALAVVSAGIKKAELILKLSRQNERTGRALVSALKMPGQKIRIITSHQDLKKYSGRADAWIVYGSDETVRRLQKLPSPGVKWVSHGHRLSMSIIFDSALRRNYGAVVEQCARDIWLYDQRGCLSPQTVWVERSSQKFARSLYDELIRLKCQYGPVRRPAHMRSLRGRVLSELHVRSLNPRNLTLIGAKEAVVYQLKHGPVCGPCGGQIIAVKRFKGVTEIVGGARRLWSHLQGIAVAGTAREKRSVRNAFDTSSAVYFSAVGRLQSPPLDWNP